MTKSNLAHVQDSICSWSNDTAINVIGFHKGENMIGPETVFVNETPPQMFWDETKELLMLILPFN